MEAGESQPPGLTACKPAEARNELELLARAEVVANVINSNFAIKVRADEHEDELAVFVEVDVVQAIHPTKA